VVGGNDLVAWKHLHSAERDFLLLKKFEGKRREELRNVFFKEAEILEESGGL
jgi:hypothetical protein